MSGWVQYLLLGLMDLILVINNFNKVDAEALKSYQRGGR